MSDLTVFDSDGVHHIMWLQERDMSCGPACVYMIKSNRARMSLAGGEDTVRDVSSSLPGGYTDSDGTNVTALAQQLTMMEIPSSYKMVDIPTYFVQNRPLFIAHIAWKNGGGHFIVVSRKTRSGNLVCLDPWYGLSETPVAALPTYTVVQSDRAQMSYREPFVGKFSGWIATT